MMKNANPNFAAILLLGLMLFAAGCSSDGGSASAEDAKNLQNIRDGKTQFDPKGTVPSSELNSKLPPP